MPEPAYGLTWTVRTTFLSYLSSLPDGRASLAGGATVTPDRGITFPLRRAEIDPATGAGYAGFSGEVHFSAHLGLLSVRIGDPRVEVTEGAGRVVVTTGSGRVMLATFAAEIESGTYGVRWKGATVQLTEAGGELFGGAYGAGEPLDPFVVVVPAWKAFAPR